MSSVATFPHATGADLVYALVWEQHLTDPITVETFTRIAGATDLTITLVTPSGSTRKFRATGGTAGYYIVRHSVTFTSGFSDSRTVMLDVSDR